MADGVLLTAAFSAGVVTFFSPCATALLPVYLSHYLTSGSPEGPSAEGSSKAPRLLVGGLTAGIVGSGLLVGALVDRVLSFGDRGALDAVLGVAGALLLGIGSYLAFEAARGIEPSARAALRARIVRGLVVGAAASMGMTTVYLTIGLAFNLGLSRIPSALPWIAFASAWLVVALGVLLVLGRNPLTFLPKIRGPRGRGLSAFYLFGIGYALIASGCFLPVFALVVGAALALGVGDAAQVMVSYAAGSAVVLLTVSASAGAAEGLVFRTIRAWRRHVYRLGGVIVILSGAYVLWYDWTFLLSGGV